MNKSDYLILFGIVVLLVLAVYIIIDNKRDEDNCRLDPLTYGARTYNDLTNQALKCDCSFDSVAYSRFSFNSSGITYVQDEVKSNYKYPDFSNISLSIVQTDTYNSS